MTHDSQIKICASFLKNCKLLFTFFEHLLWHVCACFKTHKNSKDQAHSLNWSVIGLCFLETGEWSQEDLCWYSVFISFSADRARTMTSRRNSALVACNIFSAFIRLKRLFLMEWFYRVWQLLCVNVKSVRTISLKEEKIGSLIKGIMLLCNKCKCVLVWSLWLHAQTTFTDFNLKTKSIRLNFHAFLFKGPILCYILK